VQTDQWPSNRLSAPEAHVGQTSLVRTTLIGLALVAVLARTPTGQERFDGSLWLVAPPGAKPTLSATTSARDLQRRFGPGSLRFDRIPDGEYGDLPGAILFPTDSLRRIELTWSDPDTRMTLERAQLRGDRTHWRIAPGITLGTPLAELQRLNRKPISFSGFGFDGSGVIRFWNGGRLRALDEIEPPRVFLRLSQSPGTPDLESASGDRILSSDLPGLSTMRLFVGEISVSY
jgi:hypothetical protein